MAVKTITIDLEAYETLVRARQGNESFSTIIKNTLGAASHTGAALLRGLSDIDAGDDFLDAMDRVVAEREHDLVSGEAPAAETPEDVRE